MPRGGAHFSSEQLVRVLSYYDVGIIHQLKPLFVGNRRAPKMVGVCLVGGIFVGGALLVSVGIGAMFTLVLASALYRGLDIRCGCFSTAGSDSISCATLIRACVILLLSILAYCSLVFLQPRAGHTID
jgi:hypothetical protein